MTITGLWDKYNNWHSLCDYKFKVSKAQNQTIFLSAPLVQSRTPDNMFISDIVGAVDKFFYSMSIETKLVSK